MADNLTSLDEALERLVHGTEVGEVVQPLAALLQLARSLRPAQHQHGEQGDLGVIEPEMPRSSRWRYLRARLPAPLASRVQPRRASRRSASTTVCSS